MTVKFTTEKELNEFLSGIAPNKEDPFVPLHTPSTYDSSGRLRERTKEFKEGCEAYWKTSGFSLLDCSDELRKNKTVICSVVQWFPRELKNAHPDFLNDSEKTNEITDWFFVSVLPSSEISRSKLHEWIKYYLNPSSQDIWFYRWLCLNNRFSAISKRFQTVQFFVDALNAHPTKAKLVSNPYELGFEKGVLFPQEFLNDNAFRIAHFNAMKQIGELDDDYNDNSGAKYLVSIFCLKGTELANQLLSSETPLTDYVKAIGLEQVTSQK